MAQNKLQPASPALLSNQTRWLLATALACWAPLLPHLPEWLSGLSGLLLLWYGLLQWRKAPLSALPSRTLLTVFALGGSAAIGIHYQTLFGRSPGVALLALLFSLKLLEARTRRDGYALVLLGCFLLLSQFFYSQRIIGAVSMLAGVVVITTALAMLNHPRQEPRQALRLAGVLLAQSIPFMLLLFLLFPRIQGPLWGLPADAFAGTTGLGDTMSPGAISQLSQSEAIVFRARFSGELDGRTPPQSDLYWRGPVLTDFDGRTWKIGRPATPISGLPYTVPGKPVSYAVTLEPHNRQWLFALELPAGIPTDAIMTSDFQLLTKQPVRGRIRYEASSAIAPRPLAGRAEFNAVLIDALQLPADFNPRARALAAAWHQELGSNDVALVSRMLAYLRNEKFFYTLAPPPLGEDTVDDFLFETRRGFCEHYAAAFVFMMRAAGIPARVVTGYQGGELNPVDGTLIVRQLDAHAWSEVWLRGQGWQRVDPTAAVAPARVERNLAGALPANEALPLLARSQFSWLHGMRYRWDALANTWNQWVIGYNPQHQRSLLASLGLYAAGWQQTTALFTALCGVLLLGFTAWALRNRQPLDPAAAAWQRLSAKLTRRGLARQPWEGPTTYAERIAATLDDNPEEAALAAEVCDIAALYENLRYAAPNRDPAQQKLLLRELKRRVTRLKPLR